MSRSYRKSPHLGHTTADSEKSDKARAHRRERAAVRSEMRGPLSLAAIQLQPLRRRVSNVWLYAKDGKQYCPLRVRRDGRALRVLSAPGYAQTPADAHKVLAK